MNLIEIRSKCEEKLYESFLLKNGFINLDFHGKFRTFNCKEEE